MDANELDGAGVGEAGAAAVAGRTVAAAEAAARPPVDATRDDRAVDDPTGATYQCASVDTHNQADQ